MDKYEECAMRIIAALEERAEGRLSPQGKRQTIIKLLVEYFPQVTDCRAEKYGVQSD